MAINKNFVIKNGVQVSTDLIIGDADTNKVGIGTTVPGYDLHVGVARGSRGGIGATDIVVSGVATVTNLNVTGLSTFAGALNVDGTVDFSKDVVFNGTNDITYDQSESALVFNDGAAIRVGTSSDFSISHDGSNTILRENGTGDLQIYASRIELGGASVDETTAVFTENGAAELWFNNEKKLETVAIGATIFGDFIVAGVTTTQKLNVTGVATVGGALSLPDNTKAQFGTGGDLLIYHDSLNSYIDDQGTGDLIIRGSADIKLQSASGENYIIANDTGSVEQYFDNSKKTETTSGGFKVTGITTLTDRLHVQSGVSTFDADVRFGIGATVGFGTSAFFRDDAAIFLGNDLDLKIHHDGADSRIQDVGTGDLIIQGSADIKLQSASGENYIIANDTGSVDISFDNSKKLETTSGGLKVTGITTLTNRLHVEAGISTFDADVRFGIGATVGFGTSAFFRDDAAIFLGNDSDLKIHHDGSNSYISNVGSGNLYIDGDTDDLVLQAGDDVRIQTQGNENAIVAKGDGSVEIYYDAAKKVETTSGGLNVTGITTFSDRINVVSGVSTFQDDAKLTFGAQSDLLIQHDGTDTEIYNKTNNLKIRSDDLDIQDYTNGHSMITADKDGSVDLYYDNYNALQTTPQGINVSGVTTSNRLNISGVSTFTGLVDANGGAHINNLRLGIDADNDITTSSGNLTLDSSGGTVRVNDNFTVDGLIDGNGGAHIDNLRLGIDADNDITTSSGNLTLDSSGGTVEVNDNLQVDGQADLNGDINLGNATSDTITATGRFDSNLVPNGDTEDLGTSSQEWNDLFLDGTAHVDVLDVDETAFITTKLSVGTGATIFANGNIAAAGVATVGNSIDLFGTGPRITFNDENENPDFYIEANGTQFLIQDASNDAQRLRIQSNGVVDIPGNTNFSAGIDVVGDITGTTKISIGSGVTAFANGNLAVAGITTINGLVDANGGAHINNLRLGVDADNDITTSSGNLTLDSSGGTVRVNDNFTVDGTLLASGNVDITGNVDIDDTTQSTSATTGALKVDGGVGIAKNLNVGGNLTVTGTTTFNGGTITLGDADTDNVVFSADVDSNIIPDDDDTFDLGSSSKEWQDLFLDGTAHIDVLDVDETAFVTTKLTVGTGVTIQNHGGVSIAGITTIGGSLGVTGNITASGDATLNGGDLTLSSTAPSIIFTETNDNPDFEIEANGGVLSFTDTTNSSTKLQVHTSGITVPSGFALIGSGITMHAHGGMAIAGITTMGGDLTISNATPTINLIDTNNDSDYLIKNGNGEFNIQDVTNSSNRLTISSAGVITIPGNTNFSTNIDVDGTAHVDVLDVDETAFVTESLSVGTGVTAVASTGNIAAAGIVTANGGFVGNLTGDVTGALTGAATRVTVTDQSSDTSCNVLFTQSATGDQLPHTGTNLTFNSSSGSLTATTFVGNGDFVDIDVDGTADLDNIDVDGTANFADDVTLVAAGSSTITFDADQHVVTIQDNIRLNIGNSSDLSIYHNGIDSYIQEQGTGNLKLVTQASGIVTIEEADANIAMFTADSGVKLYDGANNIRLQTTTDGVDISGTGSIKVPNGTTAQRNASPASGDFRYNTTTGKFEGYTSEWGDIGGSGGVEETDTSVSTTSATSCGSFAIASFRSASIIAQITQGSNYQVGRYLVIHDGTNVTTIEESAVATGSMLGTFEGVINSSNLEFRVTMGSSSSATVTTKIDTVTV